jgi:hypothetical protein
MDAQLDGVVHNLQVLLVVYDYSILGLKLSLVHSSVVLAWRQYSLIKSRAVLRTLHNLRSPLPAQHSD